MNGKTTEGNMCKRKTQSKLKLYGVHNIYSIFTFDTKTIKKLKTSKNKGAQLVRM